MKLPAEKSDWLGIISSVGCILHCLATPLAIFATQSVLPKGVAHYGVDFLFVGLAAVAVWSSVRRSVSVLAQTILVAAWALFAGSVLLQNQWVIAPVLMYTGSAALIIGHVLNIRQCRHPKVARKITLTTKEKIAA